MDFVIDKPDNNRPGHADIKGAAFSESCKNKELIKSLTKNYRVLPLYEKALADDTMVRFNSIKNNEVLACRWREFKSAYATRKHIPFEFPHINDFHFYNYHTCYKPSQSVTNRTNFRLHLIDGPGVDELGDLPIPSDFKVRHIKKKTPRKPVLHKEKIKRKK